MRTTDLNATRAATTSVRTIAARYRRRETIVLFVGVAAVLLAAVVALTYPGAGLDRVSAWQALIHPDSGFGTTVIYEWRLPRVTAAIVVGAGLAIAGTLFRP
ncbi:iron chelate uptake ABC transporter family permease subunit [Corynebacterium sp. LaCa97]|uniref:iron chelate uptake ABC transporter family permease subunit n=1 Tax=Corynebacterium sp. LaCa97 TaxID=3391431 RepID=UPI0039892ABF